MYLMMLSTLFDGPPEMQAPPCGGVLIPDFRTELAAFRGMISLSSNGADSAFAQTLVKLEAAGFLEEFTWADMHREEWGDSKPDGLELGSYKRWRKKNLKGFKRPHFGEVILNTPRPLPVEAADAL
jgi:hypothetical protein